jgi:iron complex outermembrane receptor protein
MNASHPLHLRKRARSCALRCPPIALAVAAAFVLGAAAQAADSPAQLEPIEITGAKEATAPYEAPTQGSLDAGEPQSVISQHFIENNDTLAVNYTDIINIAPSVADTTPNGRGFAESLNMSIRGFQDGQFNVTFDGIPWNDSNDFTHHSTSYFTADTVGRVTVDRGPGTAAQVGNATFGGTVAIESKDPMQEHNVWTAGMLGSFRSSETAGEFNTGAVSQLGGGRGMLTVTDIHGDGAMTDNALDRKNVFLKYAQPLGADTAITAVAMYNTLHQNVSQFGTTLAQLAQFGPSYSLSGVPSSDSYYGFNFDDIHTDFEYVDIKTRWDGVRFDDKLYTYAYYHKINETNDPSMSGGSRGLYDGSALPRQLSAYANDVAGQKGENNYRSWGDILRAEAGVGPGVLRGGLWIDYQWNDRVLYDVDWTLGGVLDPYGDYGGYQRYLHDDLTTIDPFVEYEFHPIENLTLTPGVRYASFGRKIDAVVNPGTGGPSSTSHTWSGVQPSLYALYRVTSNASVYAQYARGFLAPKDKVMFNASQSAADAFSPQRTDNLQLGGTWKTERLTLSADVYHIHFTNFTSVAGGGSTLVLTGGGGAVFKGEEIEATGALGAGFSLYANFSHNPATYDDGTPVQFAPSGTHALGLIYDANGLYASLISKYIGSTVQPGNQGPVTYGALGTNYIIAGYTTTDLALGYTLRDPGAGMKDLKLRLTASNLSNSRSIYYVYGSSLQTGLDMFMTLPGRAYNVGISADF